MPPMAWGQAGLCTTVPLLHHVMHTHSVAPIHASACTRAAGVGRWHSHDHARAVVERPVQWVCVWNGVWHGWAYGHAMPLGPHTCLWLVPVALQLCIGLSSMPSLLHVHWHGRLEPRPPWLHVRRPSPCTGQCATLHRVAAPHDAQAWCGTHTCRCQPWQHLLCVGTAAWAVAWHARALIAAHLLLPECVDAWAWCTARRGLLIC